MCSAGHRSRAGQRDGSAHWQALSEPAVHDMSFCDEEKDRPVSLRPHFHREIGVSRQGSQ